MKVIAQNEWGYSIFTMLFPAYLQGDNAVSSIIAQLNQIEKVRSHFDIVVIVRGGGGEVGLSCYNNYELCKAIATFPLPILTGIGHSTNLTVAEMVSYRNAITPTELGDFIIQAFHSFSVPVKDAIKRIKLHTQHSLEYAKNNLTKTSAMFNAVAAHAISNGKHRLRDTSNNLKLNVRYELQQNKERIGRLERDTANSGRLSVQNQRGKLNRIIDQFPLYTTAKFLKENADLDGLIQSVKLMDPINVLNRGFSITTFNGKTISASNKVNIGDNILTRTASFTLESEVISKKENDE